MKVAWLTVVLIFALVGCSEEEPATPSSAAAVPAQTLRQLMDDASAEEITIRHYATQSDKMLFGIINRKMESVFYKTDSADSNPLRFVLFERLNNGKWESSRIGFCIGEAQECKISSGEAISGYLSRSQLQTQLNASPRPLTLRLTLQCWNEKGYYNVKSEPFELK